MAWQIFIGLFLLLVPVCVTAQDINSLKPGVVRIENDKQREVGTGFIVKIKGDELYIVTAAHVVRGEGTPKVYLSGKQFEALSVTILDIEDDGTKGLALLLLKTDQQTASRLIALNLRYTSDLGHGENVKILGFPDSTTLVSVDNGNVKRLDGRNLVLSGTVRGGNSGGPVILNQQAIGLITDVSQSDAYAARADAIVTYVNGIVRDLIPVDSLGNINETQPIVLNVSLDKIEAHEVGSPSSTRWAFEVFIGAFSTIVVSQRRFAEGDSVQINKNSDIDVEPGKVFNIKVVGDKSEKNVQVQGDITVPWNPREMGALQKEISVKVPGDITKGNFTFYFTIKRKFTDHPSVIISRAGGDKASEGMTVALQRGKGDGDRLDIRGKIKGLTIDGTLRVCIFTQSNASKVSGEGYCQACVIPEEDGLWDATLWLGHKGAPNPKGDGTLSAKPYSLMAVVLKNYQLAELGISADCGGTAVTWEKIKTLKPSHELRISVYLPK